eukprot:sb/3475772/
MTPHTGTIKIREISQHGSLETSHSEKISLREHLTRSTSNSENISNSLNAIEHLTHGSTSDNTLSTYQGYCNYRIPLHQGNKSHNVHTYPLTTLGLLQLQCPHIPSHNIRAVTTTMSTHTLSQH